MPTISVIVPVYNTEQYLLGCVDSILVQTFTDFELILVDDGSTDGSGAICDKYALADQRVHVVHQNNAGAAAARNTGIEAAKGVYIAFCDSDDIVSPMWLERLYSLVDEKTLPMGAYCNRVEDLGAPKTLSISSGEKHSRNEYFTYNHAGIAGYLWNALYRRDLIETCGVRLREQKEQGDYNEDLLFALSYVRHVDCIVYTGYADYLYTIRDGSLSRKNPARFFEKYAEKYRLWSAFIHEENHEPSEALKQLSTDLLYRFLQALRMNSRSFQAIKRIILSEELQTCVELADTRRENPYEIRSLRRKKAFSLFVFYQLLRWKGRLRT